MSEIISSLRERSASPLLPPLLYSQRFLFLDGVLSEQSRAAKHVLLDWVLDPQIGHGLSWNGGERHCPVIISQLQ